VAGKKEAIPIVERGAVLQNCRTSDSCNRAAGEGGNVGGGGQADAR